VSITKETAFRGSQQSFSNVYYYDGSSPDEVEARGIINELVRIEKEIHAQSVDFKEARVWTAGGTKAENVMILTTPLSGTGNSGGDPNVDRERAVLIQWPAGVNVLGRPVYLRKWFHTQTAVGPAIAWPDGVKAQTVPIANDTRTLFEGYADQLDPLNVDSALFYQLTARSGRSAQGDAVCYPWLEHHQLGDEWRT
jgi:hypothetical protein